MGTSQSSSGSPSNVPLVPPWVPDPAASDGAAAATEGAPASLEPSPESDTTTPTATLEIAPPRRFGSTRRALGSFSSSGSQERLRAGVGQYFKSGLGGGGTASRRFGGTVAAANRLNTALLAMSSGGGLTGRDGQQVDREVLRGKSAREVLDAIVEATVPIDGTQDAEAQRAAMDEALSDVLQENPDANLLELTPEQRMSALQHFIGLDVFRRFCLDVGKIIQDRAPSAVVGQDRLRQAKEYIRETLASSFQRVWATGVPVTQSQVVRLVNQTLADAISVFQGYAE